jgi:hypothetical protein
MTSGNDASVQVGESLTLELQLTDESWVDPLSVEVLTALLQGIRSLQYEVGGWNAVLAPRLLASVASANITRVSDTILSIALEPALTYDISAPETITVRVPSIAVRSRRGIDFQLPFVIYPATPRATLSSYGNDAMSIAETTLQDPSAFTLAVSLSGTVWAPELGAFTAAGVQASAAMLAGLRAVLDRELFGWSATVAPSFVVHDLVVLTPTLLNISVRQAADLRLVADEAVQLTVPAIALQYGLTSVLASPLLVVLVERGGGALEPRGGRRALVPGQQLRR